MSGVVKLEAFNTLQAAIEAHIPELRDHVEVVQAPPDQGLSFPSLAIVTGKLRHYFAQEGVVAQPTNHSAVVCVGAWQGTVQLRLACATPGARYELEERLTGPEGLFFRVEDQPGLLLTQVTACPQLGNILASWDLDDSAWDEEYAFSSQEWAVLNLQATIPALALRDGVYTIKELRFGVTNDFSTPETSAAFDRLPLTVRVNEDGTITPL
jgi:hypothetical protein